MDFKRLLERTDLYSIQTFFKYGVEAYIKPDTQSYSQRLRNANKNATDFFKNKFSDTAELDKVLNFFDEQTSIYEEVYFEIGLLLGTKMAFEINEKMEELK